MQRLARIAKRDRTARNARIAQTMRGAKSGDQ